MTYYFTPEDYASIIKIAGNVAMHDDATPPKPPQTSIDKLADLSHHIDSLARRHNWDLTLFSRQPVLRSACDVMAQGVVTLQYLRDRSHAANVERLMGREEVADESHVEADRHPVIEVRLTPNGLVVELLVSRDAWWDQQNMVGKLLHDQHRADFYRILLAMQGNVRFGFWRGLHLSDMHLRPSQFKHQSVLEEFLSTFAPSKDWFRLGAWYNHDDDALRDDAILNTIESDIKQFYSLYKHILWTSNNNYREFYLESR